MSLDLNDPVQCSVLVRAADIIDKAQSASAAAETLAAQVAALREHVMHLQALLAVKDGEAKFYASRVELMARALGRWRAYDRAREKRGPSARLSQTRAYCEALAATRAALHDFDYTRLH